MSSPPNKITHPSPLRPLKAIRKKCLDCSGYSIKEVKYCVIPDCTLWPYRMGVTPATLMAKKETSILLRADLMKLTKNMTWEKAEEFLKTKQREEGV